MVSIPIEYFGGHEFAGVLFQCFRSLPHSLKIQSEISVLNTPRHFPPDYRLFFGILFIRYHVENAEEKGR